MTNQIKPQSHKKLIVFPQDKGGIGKSFVATLLYDYLTEHGVKLKTFDLDHANSTFQRFVPEAEFLDTDVDANKLAVLDTMVNSRNRRRRFGRQPSIGRNEGAPVHRG